MKIDKKHLKTFAVTLFIGLIVFSVFALVLRLFFSEFDPVPYITAIATLSIAVLTVAYVLTTSGQLSIMKRQLDEMRQSRQLDAQPLPILTLTRAFIEPPRLYFTPPEDEHSFHSRLCVEFSIKNHGSFPAVSLVASAVVVLPQKENDPKILRCVSEQVDILPRGAAVPVGDDTPPSFLFTGGPSEEFIPFLRQKNFRKLPVLPVHLTYMNILGACFAVDTTYTLVPKKPEDDGTLRKWHAQIVSFPVEYKFQLADLLKLHRDKKDEEWSALFDSVKEEQEGKMGKDDLEITWSRMPNTFRVCPITAEQYKQELSQTGFGHPLPDWCDEVCVHNPDD